MQQSILEAPRDIAWERKRTTRTRRNSFRNCDDVTDDDLHELKGCIELGFGFNEENGQKLCNTLPALDLYFAVNRQLSPVSTPHSRPSSSFGSPVRDDPEHVKTKLRHWAQAVACSLMQSH
ncbi:hypothetical protein JHK86_054457 [Glycine max]|nr:hypothetical protein JHK86_054457 [Glycine max]